MHVLEDDGVLHTYCLGHAADDDEATCQVVVPAGRWFAAECPASLHGYSLVGCSVPPGFEFCDFELAAGMQGRVLVERHPAHEVWIRR
ncbi:hypothetical protein LMG7141_01429 [Ralstonia condita]|uniref:DUF985 domain-containing protein n=1 Tax=Ralstonia condita TaxID=3058600 RepID=A0ABN9II56_9RALS|nr:hypothetical protein LMG7141_01429 [Ralstonia sp. LMG 7141]